MSERAPARRVTDFLAAENLLLVVLGLYACALLLRLPSQIAQDSWLALLSGREVAEHGLPSVERQFIQTAGREWIDQQWLGQLWLYWAERAAGTRGALLLHASAALGATGLALGAARRLGASARSVAWVAILAVPAIAFVSWQMRTQSFALVFFVVALWLLAADSQARSRRVWWVLPLLVLWANVHGSVTLGAGLVGLRGLLDLLARGYRVRGMALGAAALGAIFVSPYALDLPDYYRSTLFNSSFATVVEWMPATPEFITAPFFALAFVSACLAGAHFRALGPFALAVLAILLLGSLLAVRNTVFFAYAALVLMPLATERALPASDAVPPRRVGLSVGCAALAATALVAIGVAAQGDDWFEQRFPARVTDAVADAARADPPARVYAQDRWADWLVWKHPELAGRVAYDVRFELLKPREIRDFTRFNSRIGRAWPRTADGYEILVLDREGPGGGEDPDPPEAALAGPGTRRLAVAKDVVVLQRP